MITKLVAFRIPTDLYEAFQERCSDKGTTVSEKLRYLIENHLSPSSQTQATSPAETDEVKEPGAEQPILEERITQIEERIGQLAPLELVTRVEEKILHLDEPLGEILERLDNIEQALPQALNAGVEDGPPEPGEIDLEEEHLDRVQGNPEEQRKESVEEDKSKQHFEWPFFKEPEKEKEEEPGKEEEEIS